MLIGVALVAMLASAVPAQATFHLMSIREVYPGSAAAPESSYVELQMYAAGEEMVNTHGVTLYNAAGTETGTFAFTASLAAGSVNQQTILIGDDGVQAAFGVMPDLVNSGFNIPAAGGAACWAATIDCVAWGNYSHAAPPIVGTPVDSGGIPDGMAIRRKISSGSCTNLLDATDDTNNSASDFADASPSPVSYATKPSPPACTPPNPPPTVTINNKPANPTPETGATFTFTSNPAGATFQCRIDTEEFASCVSGINYPGPLTEASHTFQVKATNGNGTGTPASYAWTIDKTAPNTTISAKPVDPSPGKTSVFRYTSTETGSKFECKLAPTQASFSDCTTQPKIYSNLADGNYTFEVQAKDAAGNTDASPAVYAWEVDNSLADTEPPDTAILTKPANPSTSGDAAFTYSSTEPESTFKCKLDGGGFEACDPGGKSYSGLGDGAHTFQVVAIDSSGNEDESPAGYSWEVSNPIQPPPPLPPPPPAPAPIPDTTITTKPGATTRDRTPTFKFRSSISGAAYSCKVDRGAFKACASPFTTKTLTFGAHSVQVQAVAGGVTDPTPAKSSFKVVKPKKKKRK